MRKRLTLTAADLAAIRERVDPLDSGCDRARLLATLDAFAERAREEMDCDEHRQTCTIAADLLRDLAAYHKENRPC